MSELSHLKFPAIYSQLARDFIAASPRLKQMNIPLQRVYQLLRIPEKTLTDPHASLSGKQLQILLAMGNLMGTKSEPFSIQLCRLFKEDTLGVFGLALVNSSTSAEALEIFQQYAFLYGPGFDYHIDKHRDFVEVTLTPLVNFDPVVEHILIELIFCNFAFYTRSSGLDIRQQLFITHTLGQHKQAFEQFTNATVTEHASQARIRFPIGVLSQPLKNPNIAMRTLYIEQLQKQAEIARANESFSLKARQIIEHYARQGQFIDRDQLAEKLAVSVRTLNRKLKEDGLSFQPLLDQARFSIARRLLIDGDKTSKQVAYECGIQNPAVFCRAFKKWSGKTPVEFRELYR